MKIGIITIHNTNNYGAILQAYATQEIFKKFGYVNILNYKNKKTSDGLMVVRFAWSVNGFIRALKDIYRVIPRYMLVAKFNRFINKYFNLTELADEKSISSIALGFDVLVSGSDQIWNPACISNNECLDSSYFLKFGSVNVIKISYATSIGNYEFKEEMLNEISAYLKHYDHISVREKRTKKILQSIVQKEVKIVLDPTLLLSDVEYDKLVPRKAKKNIVPYILVYIVPGDPLLGKIVQQCKKMYKLPVVVIDQSLHRRIPGAKKIANAGIEEFITLLKNAFLIITDSYHGMCFSIIYKKNFLVISSKKEEARITTLVSHLGLKNLVTKNETIEVPVNIEYSAVFQRLKKMQNQSIKYLEQVFRTQK
jgi:hypothetical protein